MASVFIFFKLLYIEKHKDQIKKEVEKAKEGADNETSLMAPVTEEVNCEIQNTEIPEKNRFFFLV